MLKTTESENLQSDLDKPSFWERGAATKWGHFISQREKLLLQRAHAIAGSPGSLLDFGCGEGRWVSLLGELGWQATCLDLDPVPLAKCHDRNPKARCLCAERNGERLPSEDISLDLILCVEVKGILETEWFLRECQRALRIRGLVVGVFYNAHSVRGVVRRWLDRRNRDGSFYQLSYRHWRSMLSERGFRTLYEEGICWGPFGRFSNSPFVSTWVMAERVLGLRLLPALSPWVLFIARKEHA